MERDPEKATKTHQTDAQDAGSSPGGETRPLVSVVIPCLDEAKTITTVIGKARAAFARLGILGEVVVADNGSTDGSQQLAREAGARVVKVARRGYGNALREGMREALGELFVLGDADDTYDFGELDRFLGRYRAGAQVVMGTRLPPGKILPGANPWLHRKVGTPVLTFVLNRLFGTRIHDVNCGMRALSMEAYRMLDLRSEGMEFASEMLIKSAVTGLRVDEVPVTLHPDRRGKPSHLHRWSDGWRHLEFMLLHAPDQLLFLPGLVLLVLGLFFALPVSLGPITVAGRFFDYHYLVLGGTLVLIGLQGIYGALLVRDVAGRKVLRPNRVLSVLSRWLDLRRGLAIGVVFFLAGALLDVLVLSAWIRSGFGELPEVRKTVAGMVLMALGAELGLAGFLHAALRRHAEPPATIEAGRP